MYKTFNTSLSLIYNIYCFGKSIINFDESKSFSKVLRKPEEQLKDLISAAKTNILKKVETIKAVSGNPEFRSSETTILLKTW